MLDILVIFVETYNLGRLSKNDFARSDVSARPFSLFIVSLAEKKPYLLNKHIVNIAPFLSDDVIFIFFFNVVFGISYFYTF